MIMHHLQRGEGNNCDFKFSNTKQLIRAKMGKILCRVIEGENDKIIKTLVFKGKWFSRAKSLNHLLLEMTIWR